MIIVDYNDIGIKRGLWQYDFGQVLRIQGGNLKSAVEIHFSLQETGGEAVTRIGTTKDGVTDVVIPDTMLINDDIDDKYNIYVFIYIADRESGETEKKFALEVKSRPKPEAFDATEDKKLFEEAIKAVNESAERAETAEQQAAKHAEQTKADAQKTTADRQEVEKLVESVSGIGEQVQIVKDYKEQAQTAATNALLSEQESNEAKEAAVQAQGRTESVADEVEQHALEVAGDKAEVERLATQVRQDKSSVEQTVQGVGNTAQQAEQSINTAKTKAVEAVNATKTDAVKAVQTEGTKQTEAVQAKGQEVINSIPSDFTTQMQSKIDKQQGAENAGKALVVGKDGNVVPGEVQNGRMKLLVRYTHKANGSMELSNLDLQTGTFTTSEPHGLKENTALYIKPLAGCLPKHIPIEIFKNNPGQWGRGNIYAHVIDDFNFQVLSKKDGDILQFTNATNSEVDVKYFTFEYNMKKITLDNINCRVIDIVANGMCSGGYFAVKATTNYGNTYSTRTSSNTYSFFSTGQTPAHYHYACRMMFDKGIVTATIPIVAMSLDGTSYSNNNVNKIGRMYTRTVFGMGMEANPNAEKENGYIKSIHPFAEEVYPFNGAYVEIWGYDE
jgi:hypothetical protein|nr:MAG TPA: MAEBL protein [Caudoviricetes sp.]